VACRQATLARTGLRARHLRRDWLAGRPLRRGLACRRPPRGHWRAGRPADQLSGLRASHFAIPDAPRRVGQGSAEASGLPASHSGGDWLAGAPLATGLACRQATPARTGLPAATPQPLACGQASRPVEWLAGKPLCDPRMRHGVSGRAQRRRVACRQATLARTGLRARHLRRDWLAGRPLRRRLACRRPPRSHWRAGRPAQIIRRRKPTAPAAAARRPDRRP
jgi:hypothetical protein